jgi:hypothetical protein
MIRLGRMETATTPLWTSLNQPPQTNANEAAQATTSGDCVCVFDLDLLQVGGENATNAVHG